MQGKNSRGKRAQDSANQEGYGEQYPLHHAAMHGNCDLIAATLRAQPKSVNSRDGVGKTPVHLAAEHGQPAALSALLIKETQVDYQWGTYKRTPLHLAAGLDCPEVLTILFEAGANCMLQDAVGMLPIHRAIKKKLIANVAVILPYQKDMNVTNELHQSGDIGLSPLQLACKVGAAPIVELLCAQPNIVINQFDRQLIKGGQGEKDQQMCKTALYYAGDAQCDDAATKLVACAADPNAMGDNGWTLLYTAVFEYKLHVIVTLCELGADPLADNRYGATPFGLALEMEKKEIVAVLLDYIDLDNVNAQNPLIQTVLEEVEDVKSVRGILGELVTRGVALTQDDLTDAQERFGREDDDGELMDFLHNSMREQSPSRAKRPSILQKDVFSPRGQGEVSKSSDSSSDTSQRSSDAEPAQLAVVAEPQAATEAESEQISDAALLELQQDLLAMIAENEVTQEVGEAAVSEMPAEVMPGIAEADHVASSAPHEDKRDNQSDLAFHDTTRTSRQVEKLSVGQSEFSHLREQCLIKHSVVSTAGQAFFDIIEQDGFHFDTSINDTGDNVLHLLAEHPELSDIGAVLVESLATSKVDMLAKGRNQQGLTPALVCVLNSNDQLLITLRRACTQEVLTNACQMSAQSAHPSTFHLLGTLLLQHTRIKALHDLFHGQVVSAITPNRHFLNEREIKGYLNTKKIMHIALHLIEILSPEKAANQAVLQDAMGNHWLLLCCFTGDSDLIMSAIDLLLTAQIAVGKMMATTATTQISPLEIVAAYGQLGGLHAIVNLLSASRHEYCVRQNAFFSGRNSLDWSVFASCDDVDVRQTTVKSLTFLTEKLDGKLMVALSRQSPLGPVLPIIARKLKLDEVRQCIPVTELNQFEFLCALFAGVDQVPSPRGMVMHVAQVNHPSALINLVLKTPEHLESCIFYVINQTHRKVQGVDNLRDQFVMAFKEHIVSTGEDEKDTNIAFMHVASLYDTGHMFSSQERDLSEFCSRNAACLYVAISAYQQFYNSLANGAPFLTQVFNSNSLLKKIITTLMEEFEIEDKKESRFICSPTNRMMPYDIFCENFRKLNDKLATIQSAKALSDMSAAF